MNHTKNIAKPQEKKNNGEKKHFFTKSVVNRIIQYIIFVVLIGIGVITFLVIFNLLPPDQQRWYSALSLAYFLPPAGKETVIPVGLSQGIPMLYWGITLWIFDLLVSVIIITNWWIIEFLIKHIPAFPFIGIRRVKPRIYKTKISLKLWYEKLHTKTDTIEKRRYGKLLPLALLIFMFVPFQGTGAMSTTILGTGVGLPNRQTFIIVAVGSLLTILFMGLAFYGFIELL